MSEMADNSRMSLHTVDGVRMAYRVDGADDAPPLVLVNSLGMDARMWEPQMEALSARFRVVRYDSRGHGQSDAPPGSYTLDGLSLDLIALLDALHIDRADVCGLSLGGMVAQWVAIYQPDRVGHIVLSNTAARIGSVESWTERIESVRYGGIGAIRDAVIGRFLSERFRHAHPDEAQRITAILEATSPEGYIATCEALRDADLRAEIGRITAPVLVLGSVHDVSTPPEQARELQQAIAGSHLVILEDAAHLANVEQPEIFTAHLLSFLAA